LAKNLIKLFGQYELKRKLIAYVKNERSNLDTITIVFKFIVKCEAFSLNESFHSNFFWHAFFKACQYSLMNFFYKNLRFISLKFVEMYNLVFKNEK
jgi:hypothetical protein